MAKEKAQPLEWRVCHGRDGWATSKMDIAEHQASEALNVHFYEGGLCVKRGGAATAGTLTGMSGINALFGGYVPGQVETARELFLVDDSATNTIRRMAASSTVSAALTLASAINTSNDKHFSWAQINGKLYIAYDSAVNRLHVYDPGYSTTDVRFSGLKKPAAPTTATMGGSGNTFTRYHKVAYTEQRSSVTVRRSELSDADSLSITDDAGITVTKPAAISEGETHWEVYAADALAGPYYLIATVAVGTGTYDDTAATIDTTTAEPVVGANTPWPSVKFVYSDGSRLYGFGVWETSAGDSHTPRDGTLYFSSVLDSSAIHDDERVSNTIDEINRIAVSRNAGGIDRGLNGLGNTVYAFQSIGIYSFQPTGDDNVPLRRIVVSKELGALNNQSIVQAIDEAGRPALYFLDPELGPYRITREGLQWVGKDVADIWATVNRAATNVVAHGVYYPRKYQIWWWLATGASNDPDTIIVYDCSLGQFVNARDGVRGGWVKWTGDLAACRCSTLMSNTLGATMSRDLKPYAGRASGTTLLKGDTGTDDNGTTFQAYLESRAFDIAPLYANKAILTTFVAADTASVGFRQTLIRNMGDDTNRTSDIVFNAISDGALETEVLKKCEDAALTGAWAFQVRLGDSGATADSWSLNRWLAQVEIQGDR